MSRRYIRDPKRRTQPDIAEPGLPVPSAIIGHPLRTNLPQRANDIHRGTEQRFAGKLASLEDDPLKRELHCLGG